MQKVMFEYLLLLFKKKNKSTIHLFYSNKPLTRRNTLPTRATRTTRNNVGLTKNFAISSPNNCPKQSKIDLIINFNLKN